MRIKKYLIGLSLLMLMSCSTVFTGSVDLLANEILTNKDTVYMNTRSSKEQALIKEIGYRLEVNFIENKKDEKKIKYYKYYRKESKNLLLYVHGGAFMNTKLYTSHLRLLESIMEKSNNSYETIMLDYKGRKYPEQNIELNLLLENCFKKYDKIILMGDSSGGNIILSTMLKRRDLNKKLVDGLVLLSPWTDISNRVKSRITKFNDDVLMGKTTYNTYLLYNPYVKNANTRHAYVSPVYGRFYNFPRTLIQYGGIEILSDDSVIVYKKMKKDGVDAKIEKYDGMIHVFQFLEFLNETQKATDSISKFIGEIFNDKRVKNK